MEIKIKKIKREEGLYRNKKKRGILKYLSAKILFEKSAIIQRQTTRVSGVLGQKCVSGVLGQKLGYDRCPYLSFFVWRLEDEIFDSTRRRDLNTKYTIFDLRRYERLWCNLWMQDGEDLLTGMRNYNGIPVFVEKGDPTPLGDSVVSLGKWWCTIVLVWNGETHFDQTVWGWLLREWQVNIGSPLFGTDYSKKWQEDKLMTSIV